MVPQDHEPGAEGEADFGEFFAEIAGEMTAAAREQLSYWGFLAELLMAECDDRDRRRGPAGVPGALHPGH